ncbi:hypothetical protein GGU11DRAFT_152207 [Lentinula aff. detonsa]|nr:hypothetical protein GGU11DRAFT_152207 [Lentinula aff. detonsa]
MQFTLSLLHLVSIAVVSVSAQDSTSASSIDGLSSCSLACITQAASAAGCSSTTDLDCLCTNAQFQEDSLECLTNQCPSDLETALALQTAECGALGLSATGTATSGSFSATGISTSSSGTESITSSQASSTSTSASSNSAVTSGSNSGSATSSKASTSGTSSTSSASGSTTSSSSNGADKVAFWSTAGVMAVGVVVLGAGLGNGLL